MTCSLEIKALSIANNNSVVVTLVKPRERPAKLLSGELKCRSKQLAVRACAHDRRYDENNHACLKYGYLEDNSLNNGKGLQINYQLSNHRNIELGVCFAQEKM